MHNRVVLIFEVLQLVDFNHFLKSQVPLHHFVAGLVAPVVLNAVEFVFQQKHSAISPTVDQSQMQ